MPKLPIASTLLSIVSVGTTLAKNRHYQMFFECYGDFFDLFVEFRGCVDFFSLQDLVTADYQVNFYLPFDGFER